MPWMKHEAGTAGSAPVVPPLRELLPLRFSSRSRADTATEWISGLNFTIKAANAGSLFLLCVAHPEFRSGCSSALFTITHGDHDVDFILYISQLT